MKGTELDDTTAWRRWHEEGDEQARAWLIERHKPLVERVLRSFRGVRPCDRDDLRGAGYLGLIKAVDEWCPAQMDWERFARFRVRAKMVDHVRAWSWVPKNTRARAAKLERVAEELAARNGGGPPTDGELAAAMGLEDADALVALRADLFRTDWRPASLNERRDQDAQSLGDWSESVADENTLTPEQEALRAEERATLADVLARLTERERLVIRLRFFEGWSQVEIAASLGIHQSRVSQILDSSMARARELAQQQVLRL
jgi:RNA polymerase sigma factor FliA